MEQQVGIRDWQVVMTEQARKRSWKLMARNGIVRRGRKNVRKSAETPKAGRQRAGRCTLLDADEDGGGDMGSPPLRRGRGSQAVGSFGAENGARGKYVVLQIGTWPVQIRCSVQLAARYRIQSAIP